MTARSPSIQTARRMFGSSILCLFFGVATITVRSKRSRTVDATRRRLTGRVCRGQMSSSAGAVGLAYVDTARGWRTDVSASAT